MPVLSSIAEPSISKTACASVDTFGSLLAEDDSAVALYLSTNFSNGITFFELVGLEGREGGREGAGGGVKGEIVKSMSVMQLYYLIKM